MRTTWSTEPKNNELDQIIIKKRVKIFLKVLKNVVKMIENFTEKEYFFTFAYCSGSVKKCKIWEFFQSDFLE